VRIHHFAKASAVLVALLTVSTTPALAQSSSGGLAFGSTGPDSLLVRSSVLLHHTLNISGTLSSAKEGDPVIVQRLLDDHTWSTVATGTADAAGAFKTTWKTDHIGRQTLRAVTSSGAAATASAASAATTAPVTVYKSAIATYFGPGFYGKQTACGITLTHKTLGVAHKTLPCGTMVDLYYKGQSITVPVIDRGPYRPNTAWDLTTATASALGFTDTDSIGAVRVKSGS
jgi:rare lipoprotein A